MKKKISPRDSYYATKQDCRAKLEPNDHWEISPEVVDERATESHLERHRFAHRGRMAPRAQALITHRKRKTKTHASMLLLRAAVCTVALLLLALAPGAVDARDVLEDARPADRSPGAQDTFGSRVPGSDHFDPGVRWWICVVLMLLCVSVACACSDMCAANVIEVGVKVDRSAAETLEMLEEEEKASVRRRRKKLEVGGSMILLHRQHLAQSFAWLFGCAKTISSANTCVYGGCVATRLVNRESACRL